VNRVLEGAERAEALGRSGGLHAIRLSSVQLADLVCLATGVFSPLSGFNTKADYESIVEGSRLRDSTVWPIPITLAIDLDEAQSIRDGDTVRLDDAQGRVVGTIAVSERFEYDKRREAANVYRTEETAHPGVARLQAQGEILVAGTVSLLNRPDEPFPQFRSDPIETRATFQKLGWHRVVGFQTRNPVHRAHEYIQKAALEICDGLLLSPLVGETKADDISAATRMQSYEALVANYYPRDRVLLRVFPAAMRYAGPREAIFHALARKNYGCTHFIVGRDHAGVGNYYGSYDAQKIFEQFKAAEIGIVPLFFEHTFFCSRCGGMASTKTCPHDASHRVILSGTEVRAMLMRGEVPPPEFTRAEVAQVLIQGMKDGMKGAGANR
jgi:sulfate adenylyltransferase